MSLVSRLTKFIARQPHCDRRKLGPMIGVGIGRVIRCVARAAFPALYRFDPNSFFGSNRVGGVQA